MRVHVERAAGHARDLVVDRVGSQVARQPSPQAVARLGVPAHEQVGVAVGIEVRVEHAAGRRGPAARRLAGRRRGGLAAVGQRVAVERFQERVVAGLVRGERRRGHAGAATGCELAGAEQRRRAPAAQLAQDAVGLVHVVARHHQAGQAVVGRGQGHELRDRDGAVAPGAHEVLDVVPPTDRAQAVAHDRHAADRLVGGQVQDAEPRTAAAVEPARSSPGSRPCREHVPRDHVVVRPGDAGILGIVWAGASGVPAGGCAPSGSRGWPVRPAPRRGWRPRWRRAVSRHPPVA